MEGRRLGVFGASMCAVMAFCGMAWGADPSDARDTVTDKPIQVERAELREESLPTPTHTVPTNLEIHPVTFSGPLRTIRVYPDGTTVTEDVTASGPNPNERLLYSNTMGFNAISPGANVRVADDIVVTARDGCKMTKFSFDVTGNINGATGPYTVTYSLTNTCPGAVPSTIINNRTIPLTPGSILLPDEQPATVEVIIPDGTAIPTNVWLNLSFSRSGAGPIVGAPAQEGFSLDLYHQTGSTACATNFGDFPNQLHGSFNAQVWGGTISEACPAANIAYHAHRETGPLYNPGANCWVVDDIGMLPQSCNLIGYEVTVKGAGTYNFEFRNGCDGLAIPGTERQQLVSTGANNIETRNLRFVVDPPVNIPPIVRFAGRLNNSNSNFVAAGISPSIGRNLDNFEVLCPAQTSCDLRDALSGQHDALNLTIICANSAPPGACCDMFVPQCEGGDRDGLGCRSNNDCPSPGTCEVTCRELPQANCSFPPPGTTFEPGYEPGDTCDPNPFPDTVCGRAACCHLNQQGDDICLNLTQNDCFAQQPVEAARQWQRGRICGILGQDCPLNACLARSGSCFIPHGSPGCDNPDCCSKVCEESGDTFCCLVEWDATCVAGATAFCDDPPANDKCVGAISPSGFPETLQTPNFRAAKDDSSDPDICCHTGTPLTCLGGDNDGSGATCELDDECPGGVCGTRPPRPLYTVWYKWVQPANQTTMRVETCGSNTPASDAVLQVFAPTDTSSPQTECGSLVAIGCSDNASCGTSGLQARLCLTNLIPGLTYYAMVGAKTLESRGNYRVNFSPGCTPPSGTPANDWCAGGTEISDGSTAFNLTNATLDCPTDACMPGNTKDLWYNYIATCSGRASLQTCTGNPDTNLAIYDGCNSCPDQSVLPLACNEQNPTVCGGGSAAAAVTNVPVALGACYKVRVANNMANAPSGQLIVSCTSECAAGAVTFVAPPTGVVDAGRPHSPTSTIPPLGIQEIAVQGPVGVGNPLCWRVDCETVRPGGEANEIESIIEFPPASGTWVIRLVRPIEGNAFTSVRYTGNIIDDPASVIRMTANAGNVNGDFAVDTNDVLSWVDAMNVEFPGAQPPWGNYGLDVDRSGAPSPQDLLDAIDLMNGAEQYEPQLNTLRPAPSPCLP